MKKIFLVFMLGLLVAAAGCKPKNHNAVPVADGFNVPEVADVVLYQVNPRVFAPSNSFQAIINRLDSIEDLGVNMLWIMPIYPIGEVKSKNSPYSVKNYKAVAPEYGTVDDLRMLVESCHERGMGVILDWVANHTAWDNVWVAEHPEWYTQDKDGNIIYPPGTDWTDVADLNYAWEFMGAIADVMKGDAKVGKLVEVDKHEYKDLDRNKFKLRFTTNHDEATKASPVTLYGGPKASMAAFVATTMLHGGMLIYGSQEVGYPETINFFHYVPVDWNANSAMREEYKKLVAIYNEHPALRSSGKVVPFDDDENNVLCVDRVLNNDNVLVIVNVRNEAHRINIPPMWQNRTANNLVTGEQIDLRTTVTLQPYQYLLLGK